MELLHIHKDTWAAVGATALIPFYRLTDTDIVLLDTGIAASDREGLTALLEEHGTRLYFGSSIALPPYVILGSILPYFFPFA